MVTERIVLPGGFRRDVAEIVGSRHLIDDPAVLAGHEIDWTRRFRGAAAAVVRPGSTAEAAGLMDAARRHGVALVPQGGNTGLAGGATPGDGQVVVDVRRLTGVFDVDPLGGQLSAHAGTTIAEVQSAATDAGWAYGVDWAARQTATVGGSVATDAGGLHFVRHGGTRRQLLGVEAVLGTGEVVSHLPSVEKDNTGFDLGALLCGSEGTLGVVTVARLRLVAPTGALATALVGFASVRDAVEAASYLRRGLGGLEAVELMLSAGLDLVCQAEGLAPPLRSSPVAALLVESSGGREPAIALGEAIDGVPGVTDAAVAVDGPRRRELWRYREGHTDAIGRLGPPHKLDVCLPAGELAGFVEEVPGLVAGAAPGASTWLFGHAADGNVHVNVTGLPADDERVEEVVLSRVVALGGSISAEHGIGRAKRRWIHLARTPEELRAMRAVKAALDPAGICNPDILFPPQT